MRDHSRKKIDNREEVRELKRTVRMSIKDMEIVKAKMQDYNMSFSTLSRNLLLGLEPLTQIEIDFLTELRKIGTNINQIARVLNSGNGDIIDIQASWERIEKELRSLMTNDS
ncbi:MobC family plasmid mobilization relaxosome protein [Aliarcobacter cryaerophilus]|uniref:MobC family plasmid mobilization relaxosome protein n=1 Tax=Aliarcobacter cryaerophilus TaxID=28198 RepID=UPI0021B64E21|nr:MobC family plasmid mobilization relaxosome protein [Aliarcobacter cryaerophilus]MCT7471638.1 MobC family plasmid mobilization relaxosome protein [Aliarcobacter cryaerophilus]